MIGCTKLLCGTATVSEAIKHSGHIDGIPPRLLQFSGQNSPLVVWNMTYRCNLYCKHCYISAEDRNFKDELSSEEAEEMIRDLAGIKTPVLLFSGGEPLLRPDLFYLGKKAAEAGLRPVISSNGTLIDDEAARRIKAAGFQYVGISIDGAPETHDIFRAKPGAFADALKGVHACKAHGVKTGIRFTVNKENQQDLPGILEIIEREGIPRFCMYHLVYAGRGENVADTDISEKRELLDFISRKTIELHKRGVEVEILTTDNHADGIYLLNYIKQNQPDRYDEIIGLLEMHGGCSAGTKFANIDPRGNVHPCQFWQSYTVGNIREQPFSKIWSSNDPLMIKLRQKDLHLKGKCGDCQYKKLCGGCRIRAMAITGDIWAEDPACYLSRQEVIKAE